MASHTVANGRTQRGRSVAVAGRNNDEHIVQRDTNGRAGQPPAVDLTAELRSTLPAHVEVAVRGRNQVTLPEGVLRHLGASVGDRLIVEVGPEGVTLRRLWPSYAGVLAGVYGTEAEAAAYLQAERAAWNE